MVKIRIIDGKPFYRYKIVRSSQTAKRIAEKIRASGYYVRVVDSSKGKELWVSLNPKWFYKWPYDIK